MTFSQKLRNKLDKMESHVCVGLDTNYELIPENLKGNKSITDSIFLFNKKIIEATKDITVAYKINMSFYEALGLEGIEALYKTTHFIAANLPETAIFADCKRAEMDHSASMLKRYLIDWLQFDCIMLTPWFGYDSIKDYSEDKKIGILLYAHDSNPSAKDIQDLKLDNGKFLYEFIAEKANEWNKNGNFMVEAGATYPLQFRKIRQIVGEDMPILTSGIGPQGASLHSLKGLFGRSGKRLIVSSSRKIIYAGKGKRDYFSEVKKVAESLRKNLLILSKE